jgi:DNA polymerase III subunit alpha
MIRKAVAKKKQKLMDEHRLKFTEGAMARGLSREVCEVIWADIEFFARYGFNKAHAADYAKVTCQTAYLKAHYPVEYLTAMLSVERDNTDKIRRYFAEAKNLGIEIAPPDVNVSQLDFTIDDGAERPLILFGLGAIKNAGASALSLIIEEREANGPFADLQDLCERVDLRRVGKRALEFVIKGKALDQWGTPPQLLDALDRLVGYSGTQHDAAAAGQMSLFGNAGRRPLWKLTCCARPQNLRKLTINKFWSGRKRRWVCMCRSIRWNGRWPSSPTTSAPPWANWTPTGTTSRYGWRAWSAACAR